MRLQVNEAVNTVIQDKAGQIVATCWRSPKKKKTIAKEFVRRWNAFEEGGLVDELRKALEKASRDFYYIHQHPEDAHVDSYNFMEKAKAALAKS